MEYTFSPNSSSQPYDPWQDFDIQRKADLSTYDEEEIEPEEGVDDVDYEEMDEEDED